MRAPSLVRLSSALVLVAVASCAAQDKSGAPKSPEAEEPARSSSPAYGVSPGGAAAPPPAMQPSPAPPVPVPDATPRENAPADRAVAIQAARGEVERAQREVDAADRDCAAACRALGSLERAAAHLCGLASDPPDMRRCDDARASVDRARSRVRASCGVCP